MREACLCRSVRTLGAWTSHFWSPQPSMRGAQQTWAILWLPFSRTVDCWGFFSFCNVAVSSPAFERYFFGFLASRHPFYYHSAQKGMYYLQELLNSLGIVNGARPTYSPDSLAHAGLQERHLSFQQSGASV